MIFSEYLRIFYANNIRGGCTRWAQPTWARQQPQARPGGLWSPHGTPHLPLHTTSSLTSRQNLHCSLSRVLALKPSDFHLFAQSSVSKTVLGDCFWYVTPSFVQLVFVLVVYILNNQLLLVLLQMSLHVEFLEF